MTSSDGFNRLPYNSVIYSGNKWNVGSFLVSSVEKNLLTEHLEVLGGSLVDILNSIATEIRGSIEQQVMKILQHAKRGIIFNNNE